MYFVFQFTCVILIFIFEITMMYSTHAFVCYGSNGQNDGYKKVNSMRQLGCKDVTFRDICAKLSTQYIRCASSLYFCSSSSCLCLILINKVCDSSNSITLHIFCLVNVVRAIGGLFRRSSTTSCRTRITINIVICVVERFPVYLFIFIYVKQ